MKSILAIAGLTWKASFRYRLFWVMAVLLAASVVAFPLLLKDDGTARGLTQILLTYSLSAITGLMGLATLWLACSSLAGDIEECQMQVVCVKPVARWKIWLGKWIGIVSLDAALLALSGAAVFGLLQYRAHSLPPSQQAILDREVFVSRASAKPFVPDINPIVSKLMTERLKQFEGSSAAPDEKTLLKEITNYVWASLLSVPSDCVKEFTIDLGSEISKLRDKPLQARIKFHTANFSSEGTLFNLLWHAGRLDSNKGADISSLPLPADSFQELEIPPNMFDEKGVLTILVYNAGQDTVRFDLQDGLEVFYPESTFAVNYVRGLGIILCWLMLLTTIGLSASSWLSFPVAAFFSITVLMLGMSSEGIRSAIDQKSFFGQDHETYQPEHPMLDNMAMPFFKSALTVIDLAKNYSPIDSLSTGRSITWGQLALAAVQIVLLLGGVFAAVGITLFIRREMAASQSSS